MGEAGSPVDHNYCGQGGGKQSKCRNRGSKELSAFLKAVAGPEESLSVEKNPKSD